MGPKKMKTEAPQERKGSSLMKQMGLLQDEESGGEEDLEAELLRLTNSGGLPQKKKAKQHGKVISLDVIEKLVLESTAGLEGDDADEDDASFSGDENDLMAELEELGVSDGDDDRGTSESESPQKGGVSKGGSSNIAAVLEQRKVMYTEAVKQCINDDGKRRRLERGLKTLDDLLKAAKAGKPVDESSIPPVVTTKPRAAPESTLGQEIHPVAVGVVQLPVINVHAVETTEAKASSVAELEREALAARRDEYKQAALTAKGSGQVDLAKQHVATAKKLDAMILAVDAGTRVDLTTIPAAPSLAVPPRLSPERPLVTKDDRKSIPSTASPSLSPGGTPLSTSPSRAAPPGTVATPVQKQQPMQAILDRQQQYRSAALQSKKDGDLASAKKYLATAKGIDSLLAAVKEGKPVEDALAELPPLLSHPDREQVFAKANPASAKESQLLQGQTVGPAVVSSSVPSNNGADDGSYLTSVAAPTQEEAAKLFGAPTASPTSVLEALQQRRDKYHTAEQEANTEGNSSKARRMNRIVKQYDDAIKACRSGKPTDFSELPVPPGFGPLPLEQGSGPPAPTSASEAAPVSSSNAAVHKKQLATAQSTLGPSGGQAISHSPQKLAAQDAEGATAGASPKPAKRQASLSINEKQYQQLVQRQQEYRSAAVEAKRSGDLELAKKYLRLAKGLEPMVFASRSGLPVNMQSMPPPPPSSYKPEFVVEVAESASGAPNEQLTPADREEEFKNLLEALAQQITNCKTNAGHHRQLGDITSAAKFEAFEQNHRKDLDALRNAYKHGDPVPKYHFETKTFPMIQCNMELGDNDLEISVIQGTQYGSPEGYQEKDMHTYVTFQFPYPQEEAPKFSTHVIKGSASPVYKEAFKLSIDRKSHKFLRIIKAKSLKMDVYYKRGFLKEDRMLGSVSTKLDALEGKCVVHECLDLMDGRKAVGGKLEFKLRLRKPLLHEQVEVVTEKWLMIDQFVRKALPQAGKHADGKAGKQAVTQPVHEAKPQCIDVLTFEKRALDDQIRQLQGKLSPERLALLKQKSNDLVATIDQLTTALRNGSLSREDYIESIRDLPAAYLAEAKTASQAGDQDKAKILLMKMKVAKQEIDACEARTSKK